MEYGNKAFDSLKQRGKLKIHNILTHVWSKMLLQKQALVLWMAIDFSCYATCRALFNAYAEMISCNKERLGIKSVKITAIILLRRNSLRMCARGSLMLALLCDVLS